MALTGLSVFVDSDEYSRIEIEHNTITVTIMPTGTAYNGLDITLSLIKARRNRDFSVMYKTITLDASSSITTTIYLPDIVDEDDVPRVRRGQYFIKATSVDFPTITANTSDFYVSLITVENFKKEYLHGTALRASNTLASLTVKDQPSDITGVTVKEVSPGHQEGWITLTYNYNTDGSNIVRTLSWCGGPMVSILAGKTTYTLRKSTTSNDYIEVYIPSVSALPTSPKSEDLLVIKAPLDDIRIRQILDQAVAWVETAALNVYIEPTIAITEIPLTEVSEPPDTDVPIFFNSDFDAIVQPLTFKRANEGHWINFRMPHYPIIKFNSLYGKVSDTRIVDIALEWVEVHEKGGFVELVPFNQSLAFHFIGLLWVEAMRGPVPLPNFWNFNALLGYRETPKVLIEMIAKKAAIDILTILGQAFRTGLASQSISRDGVSETVSYTTTGTYGIFSPTINIYKAWLDENLKLLRNSFRGPNLTIL